MGLIPSDTLKIFGVQDKVLSTGKWKYYWEIECRIEREDECADSEIEDDQIQILDVTRTQQ